MRFFFFLDRQQYSLPFRFLKYILLEKILAQSHPLPVPTPLRTASWMTVLLVDLPSEMARHLRAKPEVAPLTSALFQAISAVHFVIELPG